MKDVPPTHQSSEGPSSESGAAEDELDQSPLRGAGSSRTPKRRAVIDDDHLRAILRGSARHTATPSLLSGVQQRIHERSRGRFYADGWSRSRAATSTYIVTSLLALGIFLLAYFVLLPALPVR